MEAIDDAKQFWADSKNQDDNSIPLSNLQFEQIIKQRVKKEKRNIAEYFWASFVYQVFIYSFMCHLLIKHWGNAGIIFLSLGMVLLYVPCTYMLFKKIKAIYSPEINAMNSPMLDIQSNIKGQYHLLFSFFRFKKWYDLLVIPVSSFILIAIVFKLYVNGGIEGNVTVVIVAYLAALSFFITAAYFENKKKFKTPLRHFKAILEDVNAKG